MIDLDDREALTRLDSGGMLDVLEEFSQQCREALQLEPSAPVDLQGIDHIAVTGMGGSAIGGDLLGRLITLPAFTNRGYGLPPVDGRTLVVGISYSGDTEETLSSVERAREQGARLVFISSDGKLERLAGEHGVPLIKVPAELEPRAALGYLLLPVLKLLAGIGPRLEELEGLPGFLGKLGARWAREVPLKDNRAKQIAQGLHGKVPLLYGVEGATDAVARRWKTQINENSKQPAFWNYFPELNHNEIEGLAGRALLANMKVILLRSGLDHRRNQKRVEITEEFLQEHGVEYEEIWAEGRGKLRGIFSSIYLGDFISVYLALQSGVDPTPVRLIKRFKERLGQ